MEFNGIVPYNVSLYGRVAQVAAQRLIRQALARTAYINIVGIPHQIPFRPACVKHPEARLFQHVRHIIEKNGVVPFPRRYSTVNSRRLVRLRNYKGRVAAFGIKRLLRVKLRTLHVHA